MLHIERITVALGSNFLARTISITAEGASTMMGKENRVATLFQEKAVGPVTRF